MPDTRRNVTDSRAFQRQLERELIIGGLVIGLLVGDGLIFLIWGPQAAVTALGCFVLFLGLIVVVWLFLVFVSWLGNRE